MDGRGRALDNVFIERLWRSVKYELIYPGDFASGAELWSALSRYFDHYNFRRPHQALHYRTPAELYLSRSPKEQNKVSRYAAVFAFTAHGLARELHQNNALKPKALQSSQRAYQQPIASEPVRRFGHGHVPGATPMRSLSLAEIAALCDPGFNPLPILLSPAQILFNDWGPPQPSIPSSASIHSRFSSSQLNSTRQSSQNCTHNRDVNQLALVR